MTSYYICSPDAIVHCAGCVYLPVIYTREFAVDDEKENDLFISTPIAGNVMFGSFFRHWPHAFLLRDINNEIKLLLTLQDPMFQKVSLQSLAETIRKGSVQWGIYV